jgi:hypothetical protein
VAAAAAIGAMLAAAPIAAAADESDVAVDGSANARFA